MMYISRSFWGVQFGARLVAAVVISGTCLLSGAQSGSVVFGWTVGGEPRSVELAEDLQGGVAYVSLENLADAVGAGFSLVNDRVQLDLVGQTAWIASDGTDVYGSLNRMTLTFPLITSNGTALIAKNDVIPLFRACFRIALTTVSAGQSAMPSLLDPELDKDLQTLGLESPAQSPSGPGPQFRQVVIDPGHGGSDAGATGHAGTSEKILTLAVANLLKAELEKTPGVSVSLTRTDDSELGGAARGSVAVERNADCFVSLHAGGSFAPGATGFTVFYPLSTRNAQGQSGSSPNRSRSSRLLAERIGESLQEATEGRSVGIRSMPLLAAPASEAPAILVELGCITTPEEETLLASSGFQERVVAALAKGLQTAAATETGTP
jgi:N-acetylmuramoyl-L-alanine amidase